MAQNNCQEVAANDLLENQPLPTGLSDRQLLDMIWSKVSTIGQINSKIENLEVKTDIMES